MRDVVVIGGGLSGLAAAYELQKQDVNFTLIEVKPRVGGSIQTTVVDDFIIDNNAFIVQADDDPLLTELGLQDALQPLLDGGAIFKQGTQVLIDALSERITAPRLMRMAVSSVGELDGRYTICMENGLLFDAGSLIIASPARFAERMFYGYISEVSERLRDYHYDSILRVSLGYRRDDLPKHLLPRFMDLLYANVLWIETPPRVPEEHILLQVSLRLTPDKHKPEEAIRAIIQQFSWGEKPLVQHTTFWAEADPLSCYDDDHNTNMQAIRNALPDGITLIGNDYSTARPAHKGVINISDRLQQGRNAAQKMINRQKKPNS